MPRPGFYNDNEHRAYPFIYTNNPGTLPTSVVVDVGIVMGLDANFDAATNSVWLSSVQRINNTLTFTFSTDALAAATTTLNFTRAVTANTWETEFAETAAAPAPCATEPIWEGFLTTGTLTKYAETLGNNQTVTFAKNVYQLEPARIQNLAKSYLRSISVGNFARTTIPACDAVNPTTRPIVLNARCVQGDIRFKEGYHCSITQTDRSRVIDISAGLTAGMSVGGELCAAGSELPLYAGESLAAGSKFYGGGPACDEIITTINGIGGRAISIVGGAGVNINTAPNKITVALNTNSQNNCATGEEL